MVETGVRRFMILTSKNAQERVDQAESWSGYATLAILAGILAEIGVLFVFPHDISACEFWSLVAANLAIGIGLVIEFWCILQSIRANRELKIESDRKLGEALDRAAKTEGDLIEFRKKRRSLIQPNMELIVKKLKTFAGTKFDIGFGAGDGEQANFCWDIETMLVKAGWDEQQWGLISSGVALVNDRGPSRPRAGLVSAEDVEIHLDPESRRSLLLAATAFISELKAIGIEAKEVPINTNNINVQAIHILIGRKG